MKTPCLLEFNVQTNNRSLPHHHEINVKKTFQAKQQYFKLRKHQLCHQKEFRCNSNKYTRLRSICLTFQSGQNAAKWRPCAHWKIVLFHSLVVYLGAEWRRYRLCKLCLYCYRCIVPSSPCYVWRMVKSDYECRTTNE